MQNELTDGNWHIFKISERQPGENNLSVGQPVVSKDKMPKYV